MNTAVPHILLVDDSSTNNLLLESALKLLKFQISTCTSGEDALKVIKNKKIDLVLLDVMMPGMSGYDVLEKMKSENMLTDCAVIMVTARSRVEEEKKAKTLGASDYFEKPLNLKKLTARVKELISK